MKLEKINLKIIWILLSIGLIFSSISFLENYLQSLSALCGIFGSDCSEAAGYTLLMIPVAVWGMIFYMATAAVFYFARSWTFRLVMAGAGVETTLVWLMLSREIICIFCLLNALIIIILLVLFIKSDQLWQCLFLHLIGFIISYFLLTMENPALGIDSRIKNTSIVAKINGRSITMAYFESGIADKLYKMRNEIYLLKRDHLENLILQALAGQQGIEPGNYTGKSSPSKKSPDTPLEKEARQILIDTLRNNPNIDQYLDKPSLPYTQIPVGNSQSTGPVDAPVTVIEFSDYLCPACKWAHPISRQIKEIYKGKIRWVFKDFPLTRHPGADKLANAARCAGEQGKFWEFQDLLFETEEKPADNVISQFVKKLGLNSEQFDQCYKSGKYLQDVAKDKSNATKAGITMTPSFIINGRLNPGSMPIEKFKQRIDEALYQSRH
jgi:protein-disulfide isomerase